MVSENERRKIKQVEKKKVSESVLPFPKSLVLVMQALWDIIKQKPGKKSVANLSGKKTSQPTTRQPATKRLLANFE